MPYLHFTSWNEWIWQNIVLLSAEIEPFIVTGSRKLFSSEIVPQLVSVYTLFPWNVFIWLVKFHISFEKFHRTLSCSHFTWHRFNWLNNIVISFGNYCIDLNGCLFFSLAHFTIVSFGSNIHICFRDLIWSKFIWLYNIHICFKHLAQFSISFD